jgi:DNA-binding cell septation regulator SpoVG
LRWINQEKVEMNLPLVTEVRFTPNNGEIGNIVGYVTFVLDEYLRVNSVAVMPKLNGGYRLCYPTRKNNGVNYPIVNPINKTVGQYIESKVLDCIQVVITKKYGRYNNTND